MSRRRRRSWAQDGQASLELVAGVAVLVAIVLALAQLLAAGAAREAAGAAAQAGAMARLQGADPEVAARAAAPGWAKAGLRVSLQGRHVTVRITPRVVLPGAGAVLEARGGRRRRAGLVSRLVELFLAPASAAGSVGVAAELPVVRAGTRAAPSALVVLCAPGAAAVAGGAVALAARLRAQAPVAVVCRHEAGIAAASPPVGGPAFGAARRLATRLVGRDVAAGARGRLVTVVLPTAPSDALQAVGVVAAAAGDAPVVTVLAGPRAAAFDALLGGQDRVIVVPAPDAPEGLEALAVADAARVGRATGVLRLGGATPTRALVHGGWLLPPALRTAVAAALDGHDG